jgi:hypothetical protein
MQHAAHRDGQANAWPLSSNRFFEHLDFLGRVESNAAERGHPIGNVRIGMLRSSWRYVHHCFNVSISCTFDL